MVTKVHLVKHQYEERMWSTWCDGACIRDVRASSTLDHVTCERCIDMYFAYEEGYQAALRLIKEHRLLVNKVR